MAELSYARYGKDNIRILRVTRDAATKTQSVAELTVCILLEGDIETSYTEANNKVVVATDTQKQTAYILAKQNPVAPIEQYAAIVANHFVTKYDHIHGAHVNVIQHKWTRMMVEGKEHPHSFLRDGEDTREVHVHAQDGGRGMKIKSGINKLLVLKTTGSAFYDFHRDEFTQLAETWDRILSTEVESRWTWKTFQSLDEVRANKAMFDEAYAGVKKITLETFAKDNSASVQATMYKMCEQILAAYAGVENVEYSLPNKHYFEIDLSWHKGIKNTGKDAEVYAPQSNPNGLIHCVVSRKGAKSRL